MKINDQRGSALYIVLIFSIIGLSIASVHVLQQFTIVKNSRSDPAKLQALLNARSGIWYGLAMLERETDLKINRADSLADSMPPALFGEDMFQSDIISDTKETMEDSRAPTEIPLSISLFDTCVTFTCRLMPSIYFRILRSDGVFREYARSIVTTIASRPFINPDTVLYLETQGAPEGGGPVSGRTVYLNTSIDNSDSLQDKRLFVDREEIRKISDAYQQALNTVSDSVIRNPPLVVQYSDDLAKVPDTIAGPLFIDGANRDIFLTSTRTIVVLDELQITGSVFIDSVSFIVGGDIKLLDNASIRSVNFYTNSRIFFAGESYFRGNAMAGGDIEIYETATIGDKSLLVTTGFSLNGQQRQPPAIPPEQEGTSPQMQHGGTPPQKSEKMFSLFIRDDAVVDGILIDLHPQGGILTETQTIIRGILWSENRVCHRGRLQGLIKTKTLFDESAPDKGMNFMTGSVKELETIATYFFPYFIGVPTLIDWKEL